MPAKDNLSGQFKQLALFEEPNTGEAAHDVMSWMRDKERGYGVSEWYPGWAKDHGYDFNAR